MLDISVQYDENRLGLLKQSYRYVRQVAGHGINLSKNSADRITRLLSDAVSKEEEPFTLLGANLMRETFGSKCVNDCSLHLI